MVYTHITHRHIKHVYAFVVYHARCTYHIDDGADCYVGTYCDCVTTGEFDDDDMYVDDNDDEYDVTCVDADCYCAVDIDDVDDDVDGTDEVDGTYNDGDGDVCDSNRWGE